MKLIKLGLSWDSASSLTLPPLRSQPLEWDLWRTPSLWCARCRGQLPAPCPWGLLHVPHNDNPAPGRKLSHLGAQEDLWPKSVQCGEVRKNQCWTQERTNWTEMGTRSLLSFGSVKVFTFGVMSAPALPCEADLPPNGSGRTYVSGFNV